MTSSPEPATDPRHMLSLTRGLAVLEALASMGGPVSAPRIAEETGLARAVVARCLYTLQAAGFVEMKDRRYALRPAILRLAGGYLGDGSLPVVAQPFLDRVRDEVGESSSLGIIDRGELLYVARSARERIMAISLHVGSRLALASSSMGRVLLASLPLEDRRRMVAAHPPVLQTPHTILDLPSLEAEIARVAEQGYALVDQELDIGVRSIAVPVRDRRGNVVAAMNVGAHALRMDAAEMIATVLPRLQAASEELARLTG